MRLTLDTARVPGDEVPDLINGHRPDIVGLCTDPDVCFVVAEAKTNGDINNNHTRKQVAAFLQHLNGITTGRAVFILAVNGEVANQGRDFLRFTGPPQAARHVEVALFDGLDVWTLETPGSGMWHLS